MLLYHFRACHSFFHSLTFACSIDAFQYINQNGLTTMANYPTVMDARISYGCQDGQFAGDPNSQLMLPSTPAGPSGYVQVAPTATAIMAAVAEQPVVIYMAISDKDLGSNAAFWRFYDGG